MDNPLKNTPHTASQTTSNEWVHIYSLQQSLFGTANHSKSKSYSFNDRDEL